MPIPKGIKKLKSGLCNPPLKFNEKIMLNHLLSNDFIALISFG